MYRSYELTASVRHLPHSADKVRFPLWHQRYKQSVFRPVTTVHHDRELPANELYFCNPFLYRQIEYFTRLVTTIRAPSGERLVAVT